MRSLIVAVVILSSIVFLTICNMIYVGNRVDEMLAVCEKLKNNSAPVLVDELVSRWEHCRNIISLSTHHSEIDRAIEVSTERTNRREIIREKPPSIFVLLIYILLKNIVLWL